MLEIRGFWWKTLISLALLCAFQSRKNPHYYNPKLIATQWNTVPATNLKSKYRSDDKKSSPWASYQVFSFTHFISYFLSSFIFFNLIFKVFLIKKSLNTIHSLHFWGSDLSPAYIRFCSARILIHALECLRLKGQFHLHFSEPVSISTLIE